MLVSKFNLQQKALFFTTIVLVMLYAPNVLSNKKATRIGVIPLAMPTTGGYLSPEAEYPVNNIIRDTFQQLRSAATSIVNRQNLVGIGITDVEEICLSNISNTSIDTKYGNLSDNGTSDDFYINCGGQEKQKVALRYSNNKVQQKMVQRFYTFSINKGDEYKGKLSRDNGLVGMLYITSRDFDFIAEDLDDPSLESLKLSLEIAAYVWGSNHETTDYLDLEIFKRRNRWDYDQRALSAKVESVAHGVYDKVLKSNTITNANGIITMDGF